MQHQLSSPELRYSARNDTGDVEPVVSVTVALSVLIGSLTLTGSLIAFGKLQGIVATQPVLIPLRHVITALLVIGGLAMAGLLIYDPNLEWALVAMAVIALVIGVLIVIPYRRRRHAVSHRAV